MLDLLMIAGGLFGSWGSQPTPEPATGFISWLDHWQTLIAGGASALAVAAVTLFVWRYEVWHSARQAEQEKRRLARSLSLEIEAISDRLHTAREMFDLHAPKAQTIMMPEIARPSPVYSNHTRDLALFDDTTVQYVNFFYANLTEYGEMRTYFGHNETSLRTEDYGTVLRGKVGAFVYFSDMSLTLANQLRARLDAIAAGREPPAWSDEWAEKKPYEPI